MSSHSILPGDLSNRIANLRKKVGATLKAREERLSKEKKPELPNFNKKLKEEKDHEHSMAREEVYKMQKSLTILHKKLKGEGNLAAWVQSKLTRAADYLEDISNHLDSGEHNIEEEYEDDNTPELRSKTVTNASSSSKPTRRSRVSSGALSRMLNPEGSTKVKKKKKSEMTEEVMTPEQKEQEAKLKQKYDNSEMKQNMIDKYGKEKGTQIYFATIRKQAMADSYEPNEEQLDEAAPLVAAGLAAGGAALGAMALNTAKNKVNSAIDGARKTSPIGGDRYSKQLQQLRQSFDYDDAYAYIIEMLVAADYAEDYEAAEVMFEHMSDEFTSVILEEYIEEKARGTRKKTTVHAYDVDETLFGHGKKGKPNVQVHVKDSSGKRVKSLSNQEFNTHKLDKGHSYDFSEFQSAKKFSQTASPNKKVIKDIKRKQARGQNVHLITARSKFDKPGEFQGHLKKHGVDVDKKNIHYTGGMKGGDIGKKKVDVANAVAKQSGAKKTHMYDDAAKVHKAFEKEKKENPTSKTIKTHMVAPDKSGESRVRSFQATKGGTTGGPEKTTKEKQRARKKARKNMGEEMTAYEYWKQFID